MCGAVPEAEHLHFLCGAGAPEFAESWLWALSWGIFAEWLLSSWARLLRGLILQEGKGLVQVPQVPEASRVRI